MKVDIHNQCPGFKLTDQRCFIHGAEWNRYPARGMEAGNMMSIEFKSSLEASKGVIMYELRRNYVESTSIQLFVTWESASYKEFRVCTHLLKCNNLFVWNEIRLKGYYRKCVRQLRTYTKPIEDTWLIHDGIVLRTRLELTFVKSNSRLNVTISEGIKDGRAKIAELISPER
jgi:hypothetical protein